MTSDVDGSVRTRREFCKEKIFALKLIEVNVVISLRSTSSVVVQPDQFVNSSALYPSIAYLFKDFLLPFYHKK